MPWAAFMETRDDPRVTRPSPTGCGDRVFNAVTFLLAFVLGLVFLAAGIAWLCFPNPKLGQFGNIVAADVFLTLGTTAIVGVVSNALPRNALLQSVADGMLKKLFILAGVLAVAFFVLLIFVI